MAILSVMNLVQTDLWDSDSIKILWTEWPTIPSRMFLPDIHKKQKILIKGFFYIEDPSPIIANSQTNKTGYNWKK